MFWDLFQMASCPKWQVNTLELGDIMILLFIMILKCYDNRY